MQSVLNSLWTVALKYHARQCAGPDCIFSAFDTHTYVWAPQRVKMTTSISLMTEAINPPSCASQHLSGSIQCLPELSGIHAAQLLQLLFTSDISYICYSG